MGDHASFRRRTASFSDRYELYIVGDQIRNDMLSMFLIRDRKYHLRTYKQCFPGNEAIDWLINCKHCSSREAAVSNMKILQNHGLFHHVCDDHVFKDEALFYRFRRDDNTLQGYQDLSLFFKAKNLYKMIISKRKGIARDYEQHGQFYKLSFKGSVFVEWLMNQNEVTTRDQAIDIGRQLLENNLIRHVTDDHHFRDEEHLLYQFVPDFDRRRTLADSTILMLNRRSSLKSSAGSSISSIESQDDHTFPKSNKSFVDGDGFSKDDDQKQSSGSDSDSSRNSIDIASPRSVLIRQATADELESEDTPYIKQKLRIKSDSVGYGFVVRGDGPSYVQTVDPMGPAASAGLKVRQYIYSVNGVQVLRQPHKVVAKTIMANEDVLNMVVLVHKRELA